MNYRLGCSRRAGLLARSLVLTAVLVLGTTACSGNATSTKPGASASAAPDVRKAKTSLEAGLKAHSDGDLTTAAADYKKTLRYDPTNKFAFYNLALIDASAGNYGLAEEKYRAALKTDPTYEPALFNLAILRTSRDPAEATKLYRAAVASNKKDASAWLNLGLLLRASGQKREGDAAVGRALTLNPDLKDPAKS